MLSKASLRTSLQGGLKHYGYTSVRCVHWYHDFNYAGGKKDDYELFHRQAEFGQGEIGDKERYPHLYWNLWKGRTILQRVVQQWAYSKDWKPEKLRREAEKLAYFMKLDDLDFLERTRPEYSYLDDDGKNSVGYITDDEDDELMEHSDFGKLYTDSSKEYKQMVLEDHCDGRPVYEWQVPYGLDQVFQYKSVSTAVDIIANEEAVANIHFNWKSQGQDAGTKAVVFKNENTQQTLYLINEEAAADLIKHTDADTVVIQCGSDKLLSQMKSGFSPTNSTDVYGCFVTLTWSLFWFVSPLWPSNFLVGAFSMAGLTALNSTFFYRTFMHPKDQVLKTVFGAAKKKKCEVVLGDWMLDDYDERLNQISYFDNLADNINKPKSFLPALSSLTDGDSGDDDGDKKQRKYGYKTVFDSIKHMIKGSDLHNGKLKNLSLDQVSKRDANNDDLWCESFRDHVNNRRIDLIAQVLNNCPGDKIIMAVGDIDNIQSDIVNTLLQRRLTGDIAVDKPALQYDTYYERVQVIM